MPRAETRPRPSPRTKNNENGTHRWHKSHIDDPPFRAFSLSSHSIPGKPPAGSLPGLQQGILLTAPLAAGGSIVPLSREPSAEFEASGEERKLFRRGWSHRHSAEGLIVGAMLGVVEGFGVWEGFHGLSCSPQHVERPLRREARGMNGHYDPQGRQTPRDCPCGRKL
jgi:hypothetical protein